MQVRRWMYLVERDVDAQIQRFVVDQTGVYGYKPAGVRGRSARSSPRSPRWLGIERQEEVIRCPGWTQRLGTLGLQARDNGANIRRAVGWWR